MRPGELILTIAATRMHRALVDFASASSDMYDTLHFLSFKFVPLSAPVTILEHTRVPM